MPLSLSLGLGLSSRNTGGGGETFAPDALYVRSTYLSKASPGLVGSANSPLGSLSMWLDEEALDSTFRDIINTSNNRVVVTRDNANRLRISLSNGTSTFTFRTASTIVAADGEAHFAASWNTNLAAGAKVGRIWKSGVEETVEVVADAGVAFSVQYASQAYSIGGTTAGANPMTGVLREVMLWMGAQIDWSDPAVLAKVYAAGKPVDPGPAGALVTGTSPILYLSTRKGEAASTFKANRGTGGAFLLSSGTEILASQPLIIYGDSLPVGTGASSIPLTTACYMTCYAVSPPRRYMIYAVGGESIAAIRTRFAAAVAQHVANFPDAIYLLEGGYNSIANGSASIIASAAQMVNDLLSIAPNARYIFQGIPNGQTAGEASGGDRYNTITAANAGIAALCGSRFLDIKSYLISSGLAAAGLSPTADDTTDIANDVVPRSLQSDGLHWNDYGQIAVRTAQVAKLQALGFAA